MASRWTPAAGLLLLLAAMPFPGEPGGGGLARAEGCPANAPPVVAPATFNGFGNHRRGAWLGFPYDFEVVAHDPDGDPLRFAWDWGNGQREEAGAEVTHTFLTRNPLWNDVRVSVTDDPSARDAPGCPALAPASTTSSRRVTVADGISVHLRPGPSGANSCVADRLVSLPTGPHVLGRCRFIAYVTIPSEAEEDVVDRVEFFINGTRWSTLEPWWPEEVWDPMKAKHGETYEWAVCAHAIADVHARVFCGLPYRFRNLV